MNEISNEIRAIEIHNKATAYFRTAEQYGYKFFMELKIIRDEKLFRILGFEDFEQYTLQNFNYSRNTMNERIQTAEAWGEEYNRALGSYGKHKTRQLGLMPEHDRQDVIEHGIPTDDGIKTVEDATTREIAQYQKQLKQKDSIIAQKDDIINRQFEQMQQQETQVIEKEVIPDDYENIKATNQQLAEQLSRVQADLNLQISKYNLLEESTASAKELERKIQSLQQTEQTITEKLNAIDAFNELEEKFNDFFDKEMAPLRFKDLANLMSATNAVDRLWAMINQVEFWADEMKKVLPNKNMKIVEGEIIDG